MEKPWMTGPKELLIHGISHVKNNTDFDLRMGMICIDNAVELMIKTYLGLPKRVSGINGLSRTKFNDIVQSFPKLLDALEEYCSGKIIGIDLGDIEWFHRLRNELYHNGNGITIEKNKVLIYAEIAKNLFSNLFEIPIIESEESSENTLIGEYIRNWIEFEKMLNSKEDNFVPLFKRIRELKNQGAISVSTYGELVDLNKFRNELVHGQIEPDEKSLKNMTIVLKESINKLSQHVIKKDSMWCVKTENHKRESKCFETKKEAIEYAITIAKNNSSKVVIHDPTGRIQDIRTYSEFKKQK